MCRNTSSTAYTVAKQVLNAIVAGLVLLLAARVLTIMTERTLFDYDVMAVVFIATGILGYVSKGDRSIKGVCLSILWGISFSVLSVSLGLEFIIPVLTFAFILLTIVYYESIRTKQSKN